MILLHNVSSISEVAKVHEIRTSAQTQRAEREAGPTNLRLSFRITRLRHQTSPSRRTPPTSAGSRRDRSQTVPPKLRNSLLDYKTDLQELCSNLCMCCQLPLILCMAHYVKHYHSICIIIIICHTIMSSKNNNLVLIIIFCVYVLCIIVRTGGDRY